MEILTAVVLGIIGGLVMKALFLKESNILWAAVFGVVGGLVAYFLTTTVAGDVAEYVATIGTAVVVAGLLHRITNGLGKTA